MKYKSTKKEIKTRFVSGAGSTPTHTEPTNTISSEEAKIPNTSEPAEGPQSPSAGTATGGQLNPESSKSISAGSLTYGDLSEKVVEQCELAKRIIMNIRKFSDLLDPRTLFENAEKLVSFQAYIVNHLLEAEARYRDKRAGYIRDGSTAAAAEAEAKVSPEYRAYRYLSYVYELCDSQILLIKKFSDKLQKEFQN